MPPFAVRSADNGLYELPNLAPGHYVVDVQAEGYVPVTIERDVAPGDPTWGSVGLAVVPAEPPPPPSTPPTDPPAPATEPPAPEGDAHVTPSAELDAAVITAGQDADPPESPAPLRPSSSAEDVKPEAPGALPAAPGGAARSDARSTRYEGDSCRTAPLGSPAVLALLLLPALRRRRR